MPIAQATKIPAPGTTTIVYAHRGAMAYAPQNTMKAFRLAWEMGAQGVELDVQTSSDGVPVVFHDDVLDQLTDGKGPVRSHDAAALRRLDAGSHFGPAFAGEPIPTLEEFLRAMPAGSFVNIEIKTDMEAVYGWRMRWRAVFGYRPLRRDPACQREIEARRVVASTVACIREVSRDCADLPTRIIVSSFDPIALEAFGAAMPGIPLAFLYAPNVHWDTRPLMREIPHQAWHPHLRLLSEEAVRASHARGSLVNAWTVNEEEDAKRLIGWGVDGLITNRPDAMLAAIAAARS